MLCRQQVAELAAHDQRFTDHGARLAVIGPGNPEHLPAFRKATGFRSQLFADPARGTYKLLGLTASIGGLIGIAPVRRALSALRAGYRPGSLQGSALQLGGAAVIDRDGTIRYLFREKEAGDHPRPVDLLQALP